MRARQWGTAWAIVLLTGAGVSGADSAARLIEAVKAGDAAGVSALLRQRPDEVGIAERDGTTALHWAAHRNDAPMVELLLRAGADVRASNRYGVTPLSLACENGSAEIVERLVKAGADPNVALRDGETALMTAARTGNAAAMKALLAGGADVNAREARRGQSALMWAANENNSAAVRALVTAGADVHARSSRGFTPLMFAVRAGHIDSSRALLDAGATLSDTLPDGTSLLVLAVTNAHFELAALLAERGADVNADAQGWTALHQLVWTRRPNATLADPPPVATGALSSLELAEKLLALGADPNARMKKERNLGLADRTHFNRIDATPFLLAAQTADVPMMRLLAGRGADPTLTNADGTTTLMAASGVGIWVVGENPGTNDEALEAVKLALELGGDVNAVNAFGYTALHGAAHRGAPAIVELLVGKGARLDVALTRTGGGALGWKEGWTPLRIAEGVFYSNTFKRSEETADVLRRLMRERGLPIESPTPDPAGDVAPTAPRD
jgi:ankyrin repeat protein